MSIKFDIKFFATSKAFVAFFGMAISLSCGANHAAYARTDISSTALEAHVRFLADDLLEGRNNGSSGYEISARYVAAQFASMGLLAGNQGAWFQPVPLVTPGSDADTPAIFSINGVAERPEDASIHVRREAAVSWSGQILFGGRLSGTGEAELARLGSLDVRNKLVALFPEPIEGLPRIKQGEIADFEAKRDALLFQKGATGIVILPRLEASKIIRPARSLLEPVFLMLEQEANSPSRYPILGELTPESASRLFSGEAQSFDQIAASAKGGAAHSFTLKARGAVHGSRQWQRSASPNVLGLIRGSDPSLIDELVVVTAHLDHVGREGEAIGVDNIHNGALDNATGVALLVEIARQIQQGKRPRRSILFAVVTCEEDGLIGSRHLANNIPVGLGRPVAALNIDMPILTYDFSDIVAFGSDESTLGETVRRSAKAKKLTLASAPDDMLGFFRSSDHYSFVATGVPGIFLQPGPSGSGKEKIAQFMDAIYHSPVDDTAQYIDWRAGRRFGELYLAILIDVANSPRAPQWYSDSQYGKVYAPNAKKVSRPMP